MINKLLIYEQQYDLIGFCHIIDKEDLEAYTQNWIKEYIENANSRGHITYTYISHDVHESSVSILLKYSSYKVGEKEFPEGNSCVGFDFVSLDKMPRWVPETLELKK